MLQSEAFQDLMLQHYATTSSLTVISIGYRLAPEHPYPAGNEDCFDAAEYLVDNAQKDYGVPLLFMGGDSAGAHLSVCTCYRLLETRPGYAFTGEANFGGMDGVADVVVIGLVLNFGAYDISGFLPQAWHFDLPLVLDVDIMIKFISPLAFNHVQMVELTVVA